MDMQTEYKSLIWPAFVDFMLVIIATLIILLLAVFSQNNSTSPDSDVPPTISLSEDKVDYKFDKGSADISENFRNKLMNEIIPTLDSLTKKYDCNSLQIIGHTDGLFIGNKISNLDINLVEAFSSKNNKLVPGSNVDLGMMRALSILKVLQDSKVSGKLSKLKYFFPYSAGQMINNENKLDSTLSGNNPKRRRIELRILRTDQ